MSETEVRGTALTKTWQDFERAEDKAGFVSAAIQAHRGSGLYRMAVDADEYDAQRNVTIRDFTKKVWFPDGSSAPDPTARNQRLASNFFNRLNTQRCMYSLGAGVSFDAEDPEAVKAALGPSFDHDLRDWAYKALIHGVAFGFWNLDHLHVFPVTQFVPLWDETDGILRAGIRFWRLDRDRPLQAVLYTKDGFTAFEEQSSGSFTLRLKEPEQPYIVKYRLVPADDCPEVIGGEGYGELPIVPMWGSRLRQSTLVGMRGAIDAYDLVKSGYANDMVDCAQVYWLLSGYGGMDSQAYEEFQDRLKMLHIASSNTTDGEVTPYTQEVPHQGREALLASIRSGIYEDFGGLDVHTVSAGATNDHIDAAYQPLDEQAAEFEYQVGHAVRQVLRLLDIEGAEPQFRRSRISNQKEQVEMLATEAQWLDDETIVRKLPNVDAEEVEGIIKRREEQRQERMPVFLKGPNDNGGQGGHGDGEEGEDE